MANTETLAHANKAVQKAADDPATMERFHRHGNPAVRRAAEVMNQIASNHARNDYNPARNHQIADDALFYLPFAQIEEIIAKFVNAVALITDRRGQHKGRREIKNGNRSVQQRFKGNFATD